jgi:Protein of unknown function (DUF2950)
MNLNVNRPMKSFVIAATLTVAALLTPLSRAQSDGQKTFASSKEAVGALIQAVRDANGSEVGAILGPGSEQIVSSGDEVADKAAGQHFVAEFDLKHSLVKSGPDQMTLNTGKDDWPFPVPLVHANGHWYWDGAAGKEEILYRRIGRNELNAIKVCQGVVAAQKDYAAAGHDGQPAGAYAPRLVSAPGKQNGLYWEVQEGETPSPAGPMLAQASSEGYDTSGKRTPYHGYYYHMIKNQSGFGFLAYPADYRSSGVMTFIVSQKGVIYQKDLGEKTGEMAQQISEYKVDNTWKPVK